jgi:hypothetical protein
VPNYITENAKISPAITPANGAAGQTAIEGSALDMSGFDSACCIVYMGPITSGAATSIKLQQSDDSDGDPDGWSDITGTSQTVADDADNTIFVIDFKRPTKRYVRVYVSRATQNATVGGAVYVQEDARTRPVTQPAGVNVEKFYAAAEGTA